jgi:hypothetical protein
MPRRMLPLGMAIVLSVLIPTAALGNGQANHLARQFAEGAVLYTDSCPLTTPAVDTPCIAITVFYFREDLPNGGLVSAPSVPGGRGRVPFDALAIVEDVVIHPDGSAELKGSIDGQTFTNSGTYDAQHLEFASVQAVIPMSDGTTFTVDLQWTADGDRQLFGSNGPASEEDGLPEAHFRTPCLTANYLDHQKFRHAVASGTLNGVPTSDYAFHEAAVFNNWFHWTEVTHANC